MEDLNITLMQTALFWEDKKKNIDQFANLIQGIKEETDLIMLPEMFNTGFSMDPERLAEEMGGESMEFIRQMASEKNSAVTATLMIKEGDDYVNRLVFYYPDGTYVTYDKRHLFRLSGEDKCFRGGDKKTIISLKGWNLSPMICYDLRFPVWSKNSLKDGNYEYDLLFFLANWPIVRAYPWKILMVARAMENMAYVAGVNRIGKDGSGMDHSGDSMVVDPKGNILFQAPERTEVIQRVTLNWRDLKLFRESFAFGLDWDTFSID